MSSDPERRRPIGVGAQPWPPHMLYPPRPYVAPPVLSPGPYMHPPHPYHAHHAGFAYPFPPPITQGPFKNKKSTILPKKKNYLLGKWPEMSHYKERENQERLREYWKAQDRNAKELFRNQPITMTEEQFEEGVFDLFHADRQTRVSAPPLPFFSRG